MHAEPEHRLTSRILLVSAGIARSLPAVAIGVILAPVPLGAQSLAAVAKQEEARRADLESHAKIYTNAELRQRGAPVPAAVESAGPDQSAATATATAPAPAAKPEGDKTAAPAGSAAAAATASGQAKPPAAQSTSGEQAWRDRMGAARSAVDRTTLYMQALQTRINSLAADFTARDDPAQRAVLERDRIKAQQELAQLEKDLRAQQKALAGAEEEARRAGVPPGWLR